MLTRRGFAGFASCALCAITSLTATEVAGPEAALATSEITRKFLSRTDGPMAGYVTIVAEATIEPGAVVARHTHPGIESGYVLEGGVELPIEGQGTRELIPGDVFQVPPYTPHAGGKAAERRTRILSTYVVEKGKPLASPA